MRAMSIFASAVLLLGADARAGWQDLPDSLKLAAVGESMRVNGVPMTVRAFVSNAPAGQLLDQVTEQWKRQPGSAEVKRTDSKAWLILNQTVGEQHRSLQVRTNAAGRSEGYVAVSSPSQARTPKLEVRLPAQVEAVSIVDSVDRGHASQQVLAVSRRSAEATAAALEASLKADGWQRYVMRKDGRQVRFAANRGAQQFDATLTPQPAGSLLMMNTLKN